MSDFVPKATYPVLYDHRQVVPGNGFVAAVEVAGRTLLREFEDGWVFSAVQPTGFSGSGETSAEAWAAFLEELRVALIDLGEEAADYAGFGEAVEAFFRGPNGSLERLWGEAVEAVKSGATEIAWARKVDKYSERGVSTSKLRVEAELALAA